MKRFVRWVEDHLFAFLQRRCEHPGEMVAADILEGCADDVAVKYCRRCGSIKTDWTPGGPARYITLEHTWRRPDPFLWIGSLAILALVSCGTVPQPADPAVTQRIVAACMADGFFKMVGGRLVLAAVDPTRIAAPLIAAGVDIVCASPERFAGDISTVEWVLKNTASKL